MIFRRSPELIPGIYDSVISQREIDGLWVSEPHTAKMVDSFLTRVPSEGLILDAGCGVGVEGLIMTGRGFGVVYFDASGLMLREAGHLYRELYGQESNHLYRELYGQESNQMRVGGDIFDLPFRDETFSGIFSKDVLSRGKTLERVYMAIELKRVLQGGSRMLIITECYPDSVAHIDGKELRGDEGMLALTEGKLEGKSRMMVDHIGLTPHYLEKLLETVGFKVDSIEFLPTKSRWFNQKQNFSEGQIFAEVVKP